MREEVLLEADFIKLEGGEIPEVYFWNSYFWLTEKPPLGLGIYLTSEELRYLKEAVIERYLYIIKRDLTYKNINKPIYRGMERALINLRRLQNFLEKERFSKEEGQIIKNKIQRWFIKFKEDLERNGNKNWLKSEALKNLEKELEGNL